ncbi:dystroglycan-related [Anaeramoeba ignava]|uniref:Dystroglycan-related n=1 Tax=Anaeramoeba ignava TaxID=1746090 RepID=A0A9Q0LNE0_ANAIG|nr:dystroglycan-related [Anaeramoeba ignava]
MKIFWFGFFTMVRFFYFTSNCTSFHGSEFEVTPELGLRQFQPAAAKFNESRIIVAYSTAINITSIDQNVYAKMIDTYGETQVAEFLVNTEQNEKQQNPAIAVFGTKFVIVWESYSQDSAEFGIYGQIFDTNCQKFGGEFQINEQTTGTQQNPDVAPLPNGGFVVVWESQGQDQSSFGIFGATYTSQGVKVGSEFGVNTYTQGSQTSPSVRPFGTDKFVVVWEGIGSASPTIPQIYGQIFFQNQTKYLSEFCVNANTSFTHQSPSVATYGTRQDFFFVAYVSLSQDLSEAGVFAQFVNADTTRFKTEIQVNTHTQLSQTNPRAIFLEYSRVGVVWESQLQDGSDTGIFGQFFNTQGQKVGGEIQINTYSQYAQQTPVIVEPFGSWVTVFWENIYNGSTTNILQGIYGQTITLLTPPQAEKSIPDQTLLANEPFVFIFDSNVFSFPGTETRTYSALLSNYSALPGWMQFTSAQRNFSGITPNYCQGSYPVRLFASDSCNDIAEVTFTFVIKNRPVIAYTILDQFLDFSPFTFQIPQNAFVDPEGATLTYSAQLAAGGALPGWIHLDPNGTFYGEPPQSDCEEDLLVTVSASDGCQLTNSTFRITLINNPPTVESGIQNQQIHLYTFYSYQVSGVFADIDSTLSYTASQTDLVPLPSWYTWNNDNHTFTSYITEDTCFRSLDVKLAVTDQCHQASVDFHVEVVNEAPVLAKTIPTLTCNTSQQLNATIDLDTFYDPENKTLTYSLTYQNGSDVSISGWLMFQSAARRLYGVAPFQCSQYYPLKVIASDGCNSTSAKFQLYVNNPGPLIANKILPQTLTFNQTYTLSFSTTFSDVDTLQYYSELYPSRQATPNWFQFRSTEKSFVGVWTGPICGQSFIVNLTASDACLSKSIFFPVTLVNDPPVYSNNIPPQIVTTLQNITYTIPSNAFQDPENATLSFLATLPNGTQLPSWIVFNNVTRTFNVSVAYEMCSQDLAINVKASDGCQNTTGQFTLQIRNAPPVRKAFISDYEFHHNQSFQILLRKSDFFEDADPNRLTLTATSQPSGGSLPAWMNFGTNGTHFNFSGTAPVTCYTQVLVQLKVSDGCNYFLDNFTVTFVNTPPQIEKPLSQQTFFAKSFWFALPAGYVTDADTPSLTISTNISGLGWISFDSAKRNFTGDASSLCNISTIVLVSVNDGCNTTSQTFMLTIQNQAPVVVEPLQDRTVNVSANSCNFNVPVATFNDADTPSSLLSWSAKSQGGSLPAWLSFDSNPFAPKFTGSPSQTLCTGDSIPITVSVTDGCTTASTSFSFLINNLSPYVSMPVSNFSTNSVFFSYVLSGGTFVDPDSPTLRPVSYGATLTNGQALPDWITFHSSNLTFNGKPTGSAFCGANFDIQVTGSDYCSQAYDIFNFKVVNTKPSVTATIPPQTFSLLAFSYNVPKSTFSDNDSVILTYSASFANGTSLLSWMKFNAGTAVFSGTAPDWICHETYYLSVTTTDECGQSATTPFNVTIQNLAPQTKGLVPSESFHNKETRSFEVSASFFEDLDSSVSNLTYSAKPSSGGVLPNWIVFTPSTRKFDVSVPSSLCTQVYQIDLTVSDGCSNATQKVNLDITNVAPVVANEIPTLSALVSFDYTFPDSIFSDPYSELSYSAQISGGIPLPEWITFYPSTHTFVGTIPKYYSNIFEVEVTASDGCSFVVTSFEMRLGDVRSDSSSLVFNPLLHLFLVLIVYFGFGLF